MEARYLFFWLEYYGMRQVSKVIEYAMLSYMKLVGGGAVLTVALGVIDLGVRALIIATGGKV